jgi:hypothetical protein
VVLVYTCYVERMYDRTVVTHAFDEPRNNKGLDITYSVMARFRTLISTFEFFRNHHILMLVVIVGNPSNDRYVVFSAANTGCDSKLPVNVDCHCWEMYILNNPAQFKNHSGLYIYRTRAIGG